MGWSISRLLKSLVVSPSNSGGKTRLKQSGSIAWQKKFGVGDKSNLAVAKKDVVSKEVIKLS
jgi:hypothetical protein